jgi:hypothetical protein
MRGGSWMLDNSVMDTPHAGNQKAPDVGTAATVCA